MNKHVRVMEERWQPVGEYFLRCLPEDFTLVEMNVHLNTRIQMGDPAFYFRAVIENLRTGKREIIVLNALKMLRDLKSNRPIQF